MIGEGIQVLHVDDEPDFTDLVAKFIEKEEDRIDVETAPSAEKGLDKLREEGFDCVVSDYDMPGKNGIQFLEDVREEYPHIAFILYTGKGSEQVAEEAISADVTDYLQKESGTEQYKILANRIQNAVEQKRARRGRERMRRRMKHALESTDSVIFEIDLNTGKVFRNGAFKQLFTISPDDVPTWEDHLERVIHPDDQEKFRDFYQQIIDGERKEGVLEYRISPEAGGIQWMKDIVSVKGELFGGEQALGITRDINEQKEREQELKRINELFREATRLGNMGMWEVDATGEGLATEGTQSIYEIDGEFDLTLEEGLDFFHPEDRDRIKKSVQNAFENREEYDTEARLTTAKGNEKWVHTQGWPIGKNRVRGYIRDITEQKEYEQELENVVSIVSHDLRNPLNTLEGYVELASETGDVEHLSSAQSAIDRMNTLIEDILLVSQSGREIDELSNIDLESVTKRCWENVPTEEATLKLTTDAGIRADETRLQQVLENLFRNSVEHGSDGVKITVGELGDGFYVEDDGPGIPEDERDEVFNTGYSSWEDGTGFGLSIVKEIVEGHGWSVRVVEGDEEGARFEITGVEFAD